MKQKASTTFLFNIIISFETHHSNQKLNISIKHINQIKIYTENIYVKRIFCGIPSRRNVFMQVKWETNEQINKKKQYKANALNIFVCYSFSHILSSYFNLCLRGQKFYDEEIFPWVKAYRSLFKVLLIVLCVKWGKLSSRTNVSVNYVRIKLSS